MLTCGLNIYAQDIQCETPEECQKLLNKVQTRLSDISKSAVYLRANSALYKRMRKGTALGEAWRDSNYVVWGDVRNDGSNVIVTNQAQAEEYCISLGAKLPSAEDFVRLKIGMGASHQNPTIMGDYRPQILPNLNVQFSVWTSTVKELDNGEKEAITFQGMMGRFDQRNVQYNQAGVRCIISARNFKNLK